MNVEEMDASLFMSSYMDIVDPDCTFRTLNKLVFKCHKSSYFTFLVFLSRLHPSGLIFLPVSIFTLKLIISNWNLK